MRVVQSKMFQEKVCFFQTLNLFHLFRSGITLSAIHIRTMTKTVAQANYPLGSLNPITQQLVVFVPLCLLCTISWDWKIEAPGPNLLPAQTLLCLQSLNPSCRHSSVFWQSRFVEGPVQSWNNFPFIYRLSNRIV